MGIDRGYVGHVASLLCSKLSVNEHYAYLVMKGLEGDARLMSDRSYMLTRRADRPSEFRVGRNPTGGIVDGPEPRRASPASD